MNLKSVMDCLKDNKLDLTLDLEAVPVKEIAAVRKATYLDLPNNALTLLPISRLPLGLSELKNLKWLDLKQIPLTLVVASVAGPCSNASECQACACNIVAYLSNVKLSVEEEKLRRLNAATDKDVDMVSTKKEGKKKKKKTGENENKKGNEKSKSKSNKLSVENEGETRLSSRVINHEYTDKSAEFKDKSRNNLCETLVP